MRLVVIGGDAAGMSAATRVVAGPADAEVIVLEMGRFTSYSACGIPYVVGGTVSGGVEALVARSPEEHRRRGIDVRLHHEALSVDTAAGTVDVLDHHAGTTFALDYDHLMIAAGGAPIRPDLPGIGLPFIHGVQSLEDAHSLLTLSNEGCRRIVVVGGGYIGLEMAEAYIERGCTATVVERGEQLLGLFDVDLGAKVTAAVRAHGVGVMTSTSVDGFESGAVLTSNGRLDADLVVLGLGTRPRSDLAAAAGIALGAAEAVHVDDRQATSVERVWSAGDCADALHRVTGKAVHIPLGTYANKHGRVAGINIAGGDARSAPVLGTAITKICSLEAALTGATERAAVDAGLEAVSVTIETTTTAGVHASDAAPMTVRLCVERGTGRVLGAQIVGGPGAAKRIDTVATAITAAMTIDDVIDLDLAYAPPFSGVWDPIAVAAREAAKLV